MKTIVFCAVLASGAGAALALALAPAPVQKERPQRKFSDLPVGRNVALEIEEKPGKARRVVVTAAVCLREGPIEQLLTRKGAKEHEAILAADVDAREVHAALLTAGAKSGTPARLAPNFRKAAGQLVRVSLRWMGKDGAKNADARTWVRDQRTKLPLADDWVFAGSRLEADPARPGRQRYAANDGDVICVANFEDAMLDLSARSSNAQADIRFEASTEKIPPAGTKVEVVLKPVAGGKK